MIEGLVGKKGPRPTPKNLEWNTVERMWVTTGQDLGPNDVPVDFRDAEVKLKEMRDNLEELQKRGKNHVKSITNLISASQSVASHMMAFAAIFADLELLGVSFWN
jgi:hypothetical protein